MRFIPAVSPVQIQVPLPDARDAKASRVSYGPLVKWLRHGPFTAVTWVRFPYGSPCRHPKGRRQFGGFAQLVRAPASHAGGHWFESSSLHQIPPHLRWDFSLTKFLPDSGSMTYTRVRKQALCVLETDRRASVRTGAAMTSFSVFADTTSYFSSSCASVTRPLTPTPMYTTCRATSPDILRLSRVPIHSPASMHTMLTPATGSSSARK